MVLSPDSPLSDLRKYISENNLSVSPGIGGRNSRTKQNIYDDIVELKEGYHLMKRQS
jgi:hypothetical protein